MISLFSLLAAAPASVAAVQVPVETPKAAQRHLLAVRVAKGPVIDGKLTDDVWSLAPAGDGFTQKVPEDGQRPSDPTVVRVLYDDDAVYVGFDCQQTHSPIVPRLTRRDRIVETDSVQFDLGTRGDHKSAFEFYINASGTQVDAIRFNDTDYSSEWNENWEAKTSLTDNGWSAEFRIPLRALRFPTLPVQSWDFQASRYISMKEEIDIWSYFPRTLAGVVSHYGHLDGLQGLQGKAPIELRPFVVGRARRRDPGQGQIAAGVDFLPSAGLDLKWHPTPGLTLDATFNPDFAQVEADQFVLNLTTVPTYYPEKRPFFLEGIDAFSTPYQLLYTRRIGAVPPNPSMRTDPRYNESLFDVPEPATIYGATKLTGRLTDRWSLATVQAVTAPNTVQVQLDDGTKQRRIVAPLSSFNAFRLKRDLGDNAHIALSGTAVTRAEDTSNYPSLPPGSFGPGAMALCPVPIQLTPLQQSSMLARPAGQRCFNDAYVGSLDWRWRSPGGDYATGAQFASGILQNGPDRTVADGTVIRPGQLGMALTANASKEGGEHWVGAVSTDIESRKLDLNDLGFNDRSNLIRVQGNVEFRQLDPWKSFLETHLNLFAYAEHNWSGSLIGNGVFLSSNGRFNNFWNYYADVHGRVAYFDDREVGDGSALQRQARVGTELSLGTDSRKRVAFSVDQVGDVIRNGFNLTGNAAMTVRIIPQWDFDIMPTWQWTAGEPRFVEAGDAAGQYVFGRLDAKSLGATLRTTYTFLPRLTLQAYAQLFLGSGHYSEFTQYQSAPTGVRPVIATADLSPYTTPIPAGSVDFEQGVLNVNVVLRWEYMLGSTLFFVYTRSQPPSTVLAPGDIGALNLGAVGRGPASDAILAKISYWWGG